MDDADIMLNYAVLCERLAAAVESVAAIPVQSRTSSVIAFEVQDPAVLNAAVAGLLGVMTGYASSPPLSPLAPTYTAAWMQALIRATDIENRAAEAAAGAAAASAPSPAVPQSGGDGGGPV